MTTRALAASGFAALMLATISEAAAQPPGKAQVRPTLLDDAEVGNTCLRCHQAPLEQDKRALEFILLRESTYWTQHDMHRRAFDALSSQLGRDISKRLKPGDENWAAAAPACLVCHSTDREPLTPLKDKTADHFYCKNGVNCQACHGPAGPVGAWGSQHVFDAKWRDTHPKQKRAYGLENLRDPVVRAEKCVSCHVGSAAEGKFVTHAMYAAGHPPLPPFELATFSRDEPMHWRPLADVKHITSLDPAKAKELFSYRKGENEAARLVAVGAVVALRESVKLLAFDPDPAKPADRLDFAHFNCAACHHDLRVPARRQENGFPGVPGRPVPTTWPTWVVKVVLRHAGPEGAEVGKRFEASYEALRKAFDAVPFGDRATVVERAEDVRKACDELLALLDRTDFTEPAGLVRELAAVAGEGPGGRRDYLDADGATQLARAAAAILHTPKLDPDGKPPEAAPAFDSPAGLKELHKLLGLAARDRYSNKDLLQVDGVFGTRVRRAAEYEANPAPARNALRDLAKRPKDPPPR